jgi:hypothetical protein
MNRPDIDAIEARVNKCAPGPWIFDGDRQVDLARPTRPDWGTLMLYKSESGYDDMCSCDADELAFIAAARTDVPALIAYIRHLESGMRDIVRSMAREKRLAEYKADEVRG